MQRFIYLILFFLVLAVPFVVRAVMHTEAVTVARKDVPRLVIVTPHNQDIRQEFARAFSKWHESKYGSPVEIGYRMPGGANDIRRVLETMYRAYMQPDGQLSEKFVADWNVVWGGGDYLFDHDLKQLLEAGGKRISVLEPIEIDPTILRQAFPSPTLAGVKLYDADEKNRDGDGFHLASENSGVHAVGGKNRDGDGFSSPRWVGVCLASYGIVYNPDLYRSLGLGEPRSWDDLTDSRLAGLVALADPAHAGSAAVAYMVILQRAMTDAELKGIDKNSPAYLGALAKGWKKGMEKLLLMAANARYFTASATQVPNDVSTGDAAGGIAIDFYGRVVEEAVGSARCKFVLPEGATSITPDPVGVLLGVKGEEKVLANRFVEFLLTPEAQRLWALKAGQPGGPTDRALRRLPARRDVYADRKGWADDVDPFEQARGFNQRAEWMGLFGDTRPIWVAAWIDGRDELKRAYRAVLNVSDPAKREKLLAELADLPVDLGEIDQLRKQRVAIEAAHGDIDLWRAKQRIDWANRFREHYRRVAKEAAL